MPPARCIPKRPLQKSYMFCENGKYITDIRVMCALFSNKGAFRWNIYGYYLGVGVKLSKTTSCKDLIRIISLEITAQCFLHKFPQKNVCPRSRDISFKNRTRVAFLSTKVTFLRRMVNILPLLESKTITLLRSVWNGTCQHNYYPIGKPFTDDRRCGCPLWGFSG